MRIISVQDIMGKHLTSRMAWKEIRTILKHQYPKDGDRLFNVIIKRMQWFYSETGQLDDIFAFYESEASYRVNNQQSTFYLYGV